MEPANPMLPALRPDTPALLRRTGSLLGAVQGIQQEASAEYWFQKGLERKTAQEWINAAHCFTKVTDLEAGHAAAWLYNALMSCYLEDNDKLFICITRTHLASVYQSLEEFIDTLTRDEWASIAKLSNGNFLAYKERKCYGGNSDWIGREPDEAAFLYKALAGSILSCYDYLKFHQLGDWQDHPFTGSWHDTSQCVLLAGMVARLFQEGINGWLTYGDGIELPSALNYTQKQDLLYVTFSLLAIAKSPDYELSKCNSQITKFGYGQNAYLHFHLGMSFLRFGRRDSDGQFAEAEYSRSLREFGRALELDPRFGDSNHYWEQVVHATLEGEVVWWNEDAFDYIQRWWTGGMHEQHWHTSPKFQKVSAALTDQAVYALVKYTLTSKDDASKWVTAGNSLILHFSLFQKAISSYETALEMIGNSEEPKHIFLSLWAHFNCAKAYLTLSLKSNAVQHCRQLGSLLHKVLMSEFSDADWTSKRWETAGNDIDEGLKFYRGYLVGPFGKKLARKFA